MSKYSSEEQGLNHGRRSFLKGVSVLGGGLIVGIPLSACASTQQTSSSASLAPNALLQISSDNHIRFYMPRSEMGQGTYTGLSTILAEELDVEPSQIEVIHAGAHEDFVNPEYGMQVTGGSNSIRAHFAPLRQLGANARLVLRQAAAKMLNVNISEIETDNGHIRVQGKLLPYGKFAESAMQLDFPENAALKKNEDFKYIGKNAPRLDGVQKSTGTAEFGIDVDFEGLHRAALKHCPVFGGTVADFNAEQALSMPGVKKVVAIHNGVAVVADHYYQAKNALATVEVNWNTPEELSKFSSNAKDSDNGKGLFKTALDSDESSNAFAQGEGLQAIDSSHSTLSAEYWAPYLAHSTMEPMNCTAKFSGDKLDLWVGTQSPDITKLTGAFYGDIPKDNVTVHSTFLGGGFGRRSGVDFVAEAVAIAKASGFAVQLVWSREDDMQNDLYRPAAMARFNVGLDQDGAISSWNVKRSGPQIMPYTLDSVVDAMLPAFLPNGMVDWISKLGYKVFNSLQVDHSSVEGLYEDYDAEHKSADHVTVDPGLPLGYWRSVGHSFSGFFKESMVDEVAIAQQQDPVAFRLSHLKNNPRLAETLRVAAKKSRWNTDLPSGHFHGAAAHTSFNSYVSQVAEISIENGQLRIHKITCVVDCGLAVNPDIVKAQMESGIIYGLSAALYGEITLDQGAVQQSNFHDYQALRMAESPEIEVHIVPSKEAPSGVGEPGLPPVAAAVGNAIFAATGKRLRSLPLKLS